MHDVAVIGLGAMGSAATYFLARAGARVVALDALTPPHTSGSTHGHSRIIREAYFEDPSYVPLVRRAYENWAALEREADVRLFTQTGGLMIGLPQSGLIEGTLASARQHDIAVTELDTHTLQSRFPVLRPSPHMVGVFEHRAGVLDPEACVSAYLRLAMRHGAELRMDCRATAIGVHGDGVSIGSPGETIYARHVIVAAGAWTRSLLETAGVTVPLVVERQTMHWFTPRTSSPSFAPGHLPITLIEHERDRYVYLIPDLGHGVKAAIHYEGAFIDPDSADRLVGDADVAAVQPLLQRFVPALPPVPHASAVCLYTNTPDKHFLIDAIPGLANGHMISACSGHGFKFASAIGEVVAGRVLGQSSPLDMSHFAASRLA